MSRVQLFRRCEDDCLRCGMAQSAFDCRFFVVSSCKAGLRVDAGYNHEKHIRMDLADRFNGGCSDRNHGMFEQPAANQNDFYRQVMDRSRGGRRAVRRYSDV